MNSQILTHEILASERLRMTILVGCIAVGLASWLASPLLLPAGQSGEADQALTSQRTVLVYGGMMAVALLYELIARAAIGRFLRANRRPPTIALYGNVLIETSLPTAIVLVMATVIAPAQALLLPATSAYFLFILLSTLRLDFWRCLFTGAVAAIEYAALAALLLGQVDDPAVDPLLTSWIHHATRAGLFAVGGVVAGLVSLQIRRQVVETLRSHEERNRVIGTFGQHVSPAVAEELLTRAVELGGEVRRVAVLVLDIRDFSTYAARTAPDEIVTYLNVLFEPLVESVARHHGIVNKFLGDGFMAVFGAPLSDGRESHNAVAAALEIVARVEALNTTVSVPPTRVGIGIHTGEVVTGNVGSASRKEYTFVGDAVNLAFRIEQLNKQLGSRLLVSEATYAAIDCAPFQTMNGGESIPPLPVKGQPKPIQVYRLA